MLTKLILSSCSYYVNPKPTLRVKHIWLPTDLSKEEPMFHSLGRPQVRPKRAAVCHTVLLMAALQAGTPMAALKNRKTSICHGASYDWLKPKTTTPSRCRSELMAERRKQMLEAHGHFGR